MVCMTTCEYHGPVSVFGVFITVFFTHSVSLPSVPYLCYLCSLLQLCTCLRCVTSCLSLLLPPVRCLYVFFFSLFLIHNKIHISLLTSYISVYTQCFNSFVMRVNSQFSLHISDCGCYVDLRNNSSDQLNSTAMNCNIFPNILFLYVLQNSA